MKDIDEELNLRIKAAFDHFDDGESAEGWALLRQKYPEKKRRVLPIWWITGAAAAILLISGIALLFNQTPKTPPENTQIATKKEKKSRLNQPDEIEKPATNKTSAPSLIIVKKSGNVPSLHPQHNSIAQRADQKTRSNPAVIVPEKILVPDPVMTATVKDKTTGAEVLLSNETQNATIATVVTPKTDISTSKEMSTAKRSTEDFLMAQSKLPTATKTEAKKKAANGKTSFEVFTGTFLNYYADNDVKVNAGFGLNANLKVAKNLFLSIGAGISQNKIDYQQANNLPMSAASDLVSSPASSALSNTPVVTDVKLAAQLLNFDMPIAVKFYPTKKQNFYISTGINSNSYLTQQYTYTYSTISASSFFDRTAQPEEKVEQGKNGGFDFATSAIFAIGVNQNIGQHKLIFEPYFKPAIGNMGDKNLRINTVGLNLKFNFNIKDKK